jgi:hypothetical protein
MTKQQLLELEKSAHLTLDELRKTQPTLNRPIQERLQESMRRLIAAQFNGYSKKLRAAAAKITIPLGVSPDKVDFRETTLTALRNAVAKDRNLTRDKQLKKELDGLKKGAVVRPTSNGKSSVSLADALRLNEPIIFHPEFQRDLDAARVYRLSDAMHLGDVTAKVVIDHVGSVEGTTDERLETLIKDRKLSSTEAKAVGLAASLYNVLDERPELVGAVRAGISDVRDLVKTDSAEWLKIIKNSKAKPPGDISPEVYAALLAKKVNRLFPTHALAHHLAMVKLPPIVSDYVGLAELKKKNPGVSLIRAQDFNSFRTDGLSETSRIQLRSRYMNVLQLANRYAGMKLDAVLDDESVSDADKAEEIGRRVDLFNSFISENAEVLSKDLVNGSKDLRTLHFASGVSDADKAMVVKTARAYQRAMAITSDVEDAEALMAGGFPSAVSVASSRLDSLIARTGLKPETASRYYEKAKGITLGVTARAGTVIDVLRGGFNDLGVGNLSVGFGGYLKDIPGFADFFGNQDFCDCKHCRSILGPAAYFVDLMSFVDEKITKHFFANQLNHHQSLKSRRPDLWTLELTCENTNKPIPYLVVINEILENAIATMLGFSGNFGDRSAVGRVVYKERLPVHVRGFAEPFNLPFEEISTYLKHFDRSLADVAEASNVAGDALARLRLAISPEDYQLIIQPNESLSFLRDIYGHQFTETGGIIQKFDAQLFLMPMKVSRSELGEITESRFVTNDGTLNIRIRGEKRSSESIQNDVENIEGLTRKALDRMHRFVRLWRATEWRVGELDLVLSHLNPSGGNSEINQHSVRAVATVHRLQRPINVSVEELVALWSPIPRLAIVRSEAVSSSVWEDVSSQSQLEPAEARLLVPLFDRLFNQPRFVETGTQYPQAAATFLHPALASVAPVSIDPNLYRLQAGTGADEDQLYQLIVGLARPLGIDLDSTDDNRKRFPLTHRNLSLLYRHARLAKVLNMSIPELFGLCGLMPEERFGFVDQLVDLEAIYKLYAWWKRTNWTFDDLIQIVRPGLPAIITSIAPLAGTAGGEQVTYRCTVHRIVQPAETITFGPNSGLAATITDWNTKAQHTQAYPSDPLGVENPAGNHLAIRTRGGPESKLEITVDSASIFTLALPLSSVGHSVALTSERSEALSPAEVAQDLIDQVRRSNALVFTDTVFALVPQTAPVVSSSAPVSGTTGGESVTYTAMINGRSQTAETVTLSANLTLDGVVVDWNLKAFFTRAFRSDPSGNELPSGMHLAITLKDAMGSTSRLEIRSDSDRIFTPSPPTEYRGAEITEAQSRELIISLVNSNVVEAIDQQGSYRLKDGFNPNSVFTLPAGIDPGLMPAIRDRLRSYYSGSVLPVLLAAKVGIAPDLMGNFISMLAVDLEANEYFLELRGNNPPARIAALIPGLHRLSKLFSQAEVFDAETLRFVRTHAALFGITDFNFVGTLGIQRIDTFQRLASASLGRNEAVSNFEALLLAFDPTTRYSTADQENLAALLTCDIGLVQSLQTQLSLANTPFEALEELSAACSLAKHIGIGGSALSLFQSSSYDDLATASAALQSAFRAKYTNESDYEKQEEPFRDALLACRRNGLVAYLVRSGSRFFDSVSDLYRHFLIDVELDGCARTSRVASGIDTLQTYVQRCRMNLEETRPGDTNRVHVLPESIPDDEWAWRRSYRLWEANRKIFLYPENYLEPELRDNKSELFVALEEDLLSKELTEQSILNAYGKYLRAFDELANLTIAGSYHEKDEVARRDTLHLFGVTSEDPPVFYYRRVGDARYGVTEQDRATHWGSWEKLNIQVPVRKIAPIVHNGQLYVFWVRYVTKSQNKVTGDGSKFTGYQHRAQVEFSRRQLDGTWVSPQRIRLQDAPFTTDSYPKWFQEDGVVLDPIIPKASEAVVTEYYSYTEYSNEQPLYDGKPHAVPVDDYTLKGFQWDQLYPATGSELSLRGIDFQMWSPVDLHDLKIGKPHVTSQSLISSYGVPAEFQGLIQGEQFITSDVLPSGERRLFTTIPSLPPMFDRYAYASLLLQAERLTTYALPYGATDPDGSPPTPRWSPGVILPLLSSIANPSMSRLGEIPGNSSIEVVNGSFGDVIIQTGKDAFYLQSGIRSDGRYHLRRLNTSLSETMASKLFNDGLETLLAIDTEAAFVEHATGLNLDLNKTYDATMTGAIDFDGPMGTYLREVFFHIPFLIANHLNSQGQYEEAQRWYHFIFDPTSTETVQIPASGLSPEDQRRRSLDRNWRYREFRERTLESLRAQLTNTEAIEQYKHNPFNPHAIARLRMSAYQKSIVMKYIDNLLDWGDDLFSKAYARMNPEYLREATLMYMTAQELLGKRPAQLGDCGDVLSITRMYEKIEDTLQNGSEFLMELESISGHSPPHGTPNNVLVAVTHEKGTRVTRESYANGGFIGTAGSISGASVQPMLARVPSPSAATPTETRSAALRFTMADAVLLERKEKPRGLSKPTPYSNFLNPKTAWSSSFGRSLFRQVSPIFCVPVNDRLFGYWDRVADRLFKLRHCLDIEGRYRQLPLFGYPIDPGLLVMAESSGLTLEDILTATSGQLPPYRFSYLVEKAKAFAATVQNFGAALLSVIEKRDAEEIARLRNVQQKNVLTLTKEMKKTELKISEENIEVVNRRLEGVQYRKDYYNGLLSSGLSPAEIAETAARITSSEIRRSAVALDRIAGISHLWPQTGSPFSMKYGGLELGLSSTAWSQVANTLADAIDTKALLSGMVANFERREQEWKHQAALADKDLRSIQREAVVAEIQKTIAERSLELHEKELQHHDEVMEFFETKFSNLGLYTYLSRTLQQIHQEAYKHAMTIARLAEQAYRFERSNDPTEFAVGGWDASKMGLMAGEQLLLTLQAMEKRYMETELRQAEINQSFSLVQIDPQALVTLKEVGTCTFAIPEFYFDLFYPGQYLRRIRAVRLSIPCITGPYTNVATKLSLLKSYIRSEASLDTAALHEAPSSGIPSGATSTAQADAGVFELNFRDERYLPFEGAGAVSEWKLELPSHFRPFDYQTISDVILSISYTAEDDDSLRAQVESQSALLEGSLVHFLTTNDVTRVFSLRQDFSNAFHRLIHSAVGTSIALDIMDQHFPLFLQGRLLVVKKASMVLVVADRNTIVGGVSISLNGTTATGFSNPTNPAGTNDHLGGLPSKAIDGAFTAGLKKQHTIVINDVGNLSAAIGADAAVLDTSKLRDILLVVQYQIQR